MDYVEGTDAANLLRSRYPSGMAKAEVGEIISAVADALDYAHSRGLLHRDVKPANILLGDANHKRRILLADFGIARELGEISGLTATNMLVGTTAYCSPEQLQGANLDARADQYALGCTAYNLLTGSAPFHHSNPAVVIGQHLSAPPPLIGERRPDLAALDSVIAKALAKQPDERYGARADFATALAGGADTAPQDTATSHGSHCRADGSDCGAPESHACGAKGPPQREPGRTAAPRRSQRLHRPVAPHRRRPSRRSSYPAKSRMGRVCWAPSTMTW